MFINRFIAQTVKRRRMLSIRKTAKCFGLAQEETLKFPGENTDIISERVSAEQ